MKNNILTIAAWALIGLFGFIGNVKGAANNFIYPSDGSNGAIVMPADTEIANKNVKISVAASKTVEKYAIEIDIPEEIKFDYTIEEREWNPTTHAYDVVSGKTAGWNSPETAFNIKNHSSLPIDISVSSSAVSSSYSEVSLETSLSLSKLERCAEGASGNSIPNSRCTVKILGNPGTSEVRDIEISSVTVKVSPAS